MYLNKMAVIALSILAIGALVTTGTAWGARTEMELNSLRGLDSVYLIVQSPSSEMAQDGLTKDAIAASVKRQFESAGIKVLASTDELTNDGAIFLIALNTVRSNSGMYACSVDAQLIQVTSLARNPKTLVPATTWTSGVVAVVDGSTLNRLQERISGLVDEFITDYTSVNLPIVGGTKET